MRVVPIYPWSLVLAAGLAPSAAHAQSSFQGIGFLPGGQPMSYVYSLSGDGSTIVATASDAGGAEQPVRWTSATGVVLIGSLPGGAPTGNGEAYGASHDGSVIVGSEPGPNGREGFRWTQATGMVGLGNIGGVPNSAAYALSCSIDGSVVVGRGDYTYNASGIATAEAFRWTQATGMVGLGHLATSGLQYGWANDCSADGSVVVGYESTDNGFEGFRWTQGTGMVPLGDLPGGAVDSAAVGCSADGNTIVGWGWSNDRYEPAVWKQGTGWTSLGVLPGVAGDSFACDCTPDGSVIVGTSRLVYGGPNGWEVSGLSFIWDEVNGMRDLRDLLIIEHGVTSVAGWTLFAATGVSTDGKTITGIGLNPQSEYEGWIAHLGSPTCYPDCNGDGQLTVADFGCFQTKYVLGCP
ncbi:MAG: PEP-CTERM sorting domain-containing protein [Phycisphaerales bacterium]